MIRTERLVLRRFRDEDRSAFAAINSDPEVMATIGPPLDPWSSDALMQRFERDVSTRGFAPWCIEVSGGESCAGFVGLSVPTFDAPFVPCVEIGWRLARSAWGHGYATEAAAAVLADAFDRLGLDEVVAFTAATNVRSRRVAERIGLRRDPSGDFDHPRVLPGDPLRAHLLFRTTSVQWRAGPSPRA